jgi:antitoxin component YwqK of YwqJK toxin-antitoxin module
MTEPVYQPWLDRAAADRRIEAVDFSELGYDDCEARYLLHGEPFTGYCAQRYPDGALKCVYHMTDGIEHGLTVSWHQGGQLRRYAGMARSVFHGLLADWDEDGRLLRADKYDEGLLVGPAAPGTSSGPE